MFPEDGHVSAKHLNTLSITNMSFGAPGNRDIRHFRPILSHVVLLPALSEQILRLTILLVSRDCQSRNPVSKVFEAFLYPSVRNKWTRPLFILYLEKYSTSTRYGQREHGSVSRFEIDNYDFK